VQACRAAVAKLFGICDANRIAFASNATDALNMAIHGLALDGSHVITTAAEHNSVLRPLRVLERKGRIDLTTVNCDARGCVAPTDVAAATRSNTRAVVMSHSSNVTGAVQDLGTISRFLRPRGVVLIADVAQSAGTIPIDVQEMGIDIMAFTGHKHLHALQGIGGLYVRAGIELEPWRVGGTGVRGDDPYQPEDMPLRLEAGTLNLTAITSLEAGIDFIARTGLEVILARKRRLMQTLLEGAESLSDVTVYGLPDSTRGLLALNVRNVSPDEAGYILENSFSIAVRSGLHCAPLIHAALGCHPHGCLRVSPSYFTTDDDVASFLDALRQLCQLGASRT
jgi:cysteine desulfurase family protein